MGQWLPVPFITFVDSAGAPYAGGSLEFYATSSDTPQSVYTDAALTAGAATTLTLNSAGRPSVAVFLQNLPYKVVLKDSSANTIWTADPVSATDFASVVITKVGSGSPSGVVAGTAGSSGVLPTYYWDYTNSILYVCTTTGAAAVAVWTAINAGSATQIVTPPQGYLTPTSATPIITGDSSAATAVYYTPFVGNLVPVYNGSRHVSTEFTELTLTLVSQHALSTLYDVFVFSNSSVLTLATGPAWSNSGAGTGSRGTGAGTTELTRLNGYLVNAVSMTGRNGSTTYSIGANLATYLGSLFIDGTAGQVTCHRTWGQSRKWGVWNAYNRQPLYLKEGDSTASWTYQTDTLRPSRNQSTNSLTVFQGLAEEFYDLQLHQNVFCDIGNVNSDAVKAKHGIGWNSTTAASGLLSIVGATNGSADGTAAFDNGRARYLQVPSLGINVVTALEAGSTSGGSGTVTFYGGEDDMALSALWRG